jgi:predicted HTH transcriptional regulator
VKGTVFVSSVQKELAEERRAVKSFIENDPLLRRFFRVFLFEDLPAADRGADAVYLAEVDRCAVYVGLLGHEYGFEDTAGVSPTEREFDRATAAGKPRLIFVKGADDRGRQAKMQALIRKAGRQLIRRRFTSTPELTTELYASLVEHLEAMGAIQDRPFEDQPCRDATLEDVSPEAVSHFVSRARAERQFPLPVGAPVAEVLAHLHLLCGQQPTNAAILLFGSDPQRFLPAAEVRCMHFHGTEIQRPVPSYQVFKGALFEQADQAADFVLSKLNRSIGTRADSSWAPVRNEIPPDVVREAVVNAIAHRDYTSAGVVQVSVFADRVEVWNPGTLLPPLTLESLHVPHGSVARNPRICEALFLARYIEKYGTGTLMMIRQAREHALPEPDFAQRGGEFTAAVWRDWLTEEVLAGYGLNDRQMRAVVSTKILGKITNAAYQETTGASRPTAIRDLTDLVAKGVFTRLGKGRGVYYVIARNDSRLTQTTPYVPPEK